jgi:pimeloyl-ACP methyl ester carboxylesterase
MSRDIVADGRRIEWARFGPPPDKAPTLVLLHEGLGCLALWRDFPPKLAERSGYGVLAWSRPGYGNSDPVPLPRPLSYMHDEALHVLPQVLDQAEVRKAILIGHSDGASIAAIYAGGRQDLRVRGLVLMAPHFFVEDVTLDSIAAAKIAYECGDLRARLARYHGANVDVAFRGWNDAWLDPRFREWRIDEYLAHIRVPVLIIEGLEDEYGTLEQVRLAQREAHCPVEVMVLERCGHSPHVDQPDATLDGIAAFVRQVLEVHEGILPAAPLRRLERDDGRR